MKIHRRRPLTYDWNRTCQWSVNNFGTEMKSLTRMEMTNTSNDKARQKRHKREKATIEHFVDKCTKISPRKGASKIQLPTVVCRSRNSSARNGIRRKAVYRPSDLEDEREPAQTASRF